MQSLTPAAMSRQEPAADLFGRSPSIVSDASCYPNVPGYRGARNGPSAKAAEKIAGKAKSIKAEALKLITKTPAGLTCDEIARLLELPNVYSSRPRIAELHRQGEVIEAGTRRGESGLQITVWKAAPPLPNYPHIIGEDRS